MNKLLIASAVIALTAGAAQAQTQPSTQSNMFDGAAGNNLSFSVLGGWSSHPALAVGGTHDGMRDGFNAGARLSYNLDNTIPMSGFSIDADYFYNQSDYRGLGAQLGTHSFMGDITYHVPLYNSPWSIYGGGGIGAVEDNLYGRLHGTSTVLGFQALGGAEYQFNPMTSMFVEYRYQNAHNANIGTAGPIGNTSNNASVGLKFKL